MNNSKLELKLNELDREDVAYADIDLKHVGGNHHAVARVVVRMEHQTKDCPNLIQLAQDLVTRYNNGVLPDPQTVTAGSILHAGLGHMEDRAATYDAEQGERSMGKTVTMFNTLYGFELTEEQGWAFMELLKLVRTSQGDYRQDNYEDGAAYMGLMGEAAARERG